MNNHHHEGNIRADPEKVADITKFLLLQLDEYLKENKVDASDAFMGVHSFHLLVIKEIATQWAPGIPAYQTYRMADMTWRNGMKRLKRES